MRALRCALRPHRAQRSRTRDFLCRTNRRARPALCASSSSRTTQQGPRFSLSNQPPCAPCAVRFVLIAHDAAGREIFFVEPTAVRALRCALRPHRARRSRTRDFLCRTNRRARPALCASSSSRTTQQDARFSLSNQPPCAPCAVRFVLIAHDAAGREIFFVEPTAVRALRCALRPHRAQRSRTRDFLCRTNRRARPALCASSSSRTTQQGPRFSLSNQPPCAPCAVRFVLIAHDAAGREIFFVEPTAVRALRCALRPHRAQRSRTRDFLCRTNRRARPALCASSSSRTTQQPIVMPPAPTSSRIRGHRGR